MPGGCCLSRPDLANRTFSDLGALLCGIVPAGTEMNARRQLRTDVAVGETAQAVLAGREALEQLRVRSRRPDMPTGPGQLLGFLQLTAQ